MHRVLKQISSNNNVAAVRRHFSSQTSTLLDTHKILMPALSPTMSHGTIQKWMKKEGDFLEPGNVLCTIETDKATIEMEIVEEGYLAKIVMPDQSSNVPLGQLIAIMTDSKDEKPDLSLLQSAATPAKTDNTPSPPKTPTTPAPATTAAPAQTAGGKYTIPMPPSVQVLFARNPWMNLHEIKATGKNGRLLKGDVLAYLKTHSGPTSTAAATTTSAKATTTGAAPQKAPAASAVTTRAPKQQYEDVETTQMRKIIASRLLESKTTIPHLYISVEAQIDGLLKVKSALFKQRGLKVSVNDFVIYAAAKALEQYPQCNAVLNKKTGAHQISPTIDISFAVATDKGLLTPIIKNANTLSIEQVSKAVKDLSERARASKLKPEEFQGGSFCISNLGMFGITHFSAVINPPQAIIVAVGGSDQKPISGKIDLDSDVLDNVSVDSIEFGTFMSLTASVDRTAVDDGVAGQFMEAFKRNLEQIMLY